MTGEELLAAVQGFWRDNVGEHIATDAEECRYCPVCQLIAILRGDRPEVTDRLAVLMEAAASAFMAAFRAATAPPPSAEPDASPVQRITLDDG